MCEHLTPKCTIEASRVLTVQNSFSLIEVRTRAARALGTPKLDAPEEADRELFRLLDTTQRGEYKFPDDVRIAAYVALDQVRA